MRSGTRLLSRASCRRLMSGSIACCARSGRRSRVCVNSACTRSLEFEASRQPRRYPSRGLAAPVLVREAFAGIVRRPERLMRGRVGFLGFAIAATLAAAPARAQTPGLWTDPGAQFMPILMPGWNLEEFLQQARRSFRDADLNMDRVVDASDAKLKQETWQHDMR